ncbi:hypothetical protein GMA8713_03830 [Grimontia marina]|uniref:Uncharacterized protein n=1 Tax=Grimontia marina TaxID=646534 RepID=A0A128FG62_9GAMM|nr:hypothetical protein GMA8713_03830 [Grimontia marina]
MNLLNKAIWVVHILALGLTAFLWLDFNSTYSTFPPSTASTAPIPAPEAMNLAKPTVGKLSNDHYPVTFHWDSELYLMQEL